MSEIPRYNPRHDFDHTRDSQDYKNMDYKDRVQFHFEELWGEWKILESSIDNRNDLYDELLDVLGQMGIDENRVEIDEDKDIGTHFVYSDKDLLGCLNNDNSINIENLKKLFLKEAQHRAKDLPIQDPFNKGEKFVDQTPLPTNPDSPTVITGSGNGFELNHERFERKKHVLRVFRKRNLEFHPIFVDYEMLTAEQKKKYNNMFRTIALDKRGGDVIHPGQYDVYVVPEKGFTFMVSDKYGEATYIVENVPDDFEDIVKTIGFNKENKDEAEYPVAVIEWPRNGTMEEWRKLIENFLDRPDFSFELNTKKNNFNDINEKEERGFYERAPEGWLTVHAIIKDMYKTTEEWILARIEKNLEGKTEEEKEKYYKKYLDEIGNVRFHCSPELIKKLTELRNEYAPAPEGWMTIRSITKFLNSGRFKKKNKKWFLSRVKDFLEGKTEEEGKIL